MDVFIKPCSLPGLLGYILLSLGLHGLLFLIPATDTRSGYAGSAATLARPSALVVSLRQLSPQSLSHAIQVEAPPPAPEHTSPAPEAAVAMQESGFALPIPASQLSFHPLLLNGEVLEEGAAVFPSELSARVVVEVLVNKEGRVEKVWQQGEFNAFSAWLGEQLLTKVQFRPAESEGRQVPTILRLEFNLAATAPATTPQQDEPSDR